jgi:hypothetical protein
MHRPASSPDVDPNRDHKRADVVYVVCDPVLFET